MLAAASDDEVLAFCRSLVQEMAEHGTTALELKTGYGLSVEAELRQARLARRLSEEAPQTCSVTLLACHAVPEGMERDDWVRLVCDELIPAAARERLVDAVDVYVEDIAFSVDDLAEVARCASDVGLPLRCHADQLGPSGAAEAAVALAARSADHLNHVSATGIAALGGAPATVAVLLPDVDVVPWLVAAGRPSPARRRRGGRDRDRLQPRHLAGALDARGDRDRVFALRAPTARGARGRDDECLRCARFGAGAGYAFARQARRPRGPRRRRLPAGAVPAGPQPGGPDVRRRREGWRTLKRFAGLLLVVTVVLLVPTTAPAQTGVTITLSASSGRITFGEHVRALGLVDGGARRIHGRDPERRRPGGRVGDHRRVAAISRPGSSRRGPTATWPCSATA